jgi:hypothetical protein
MTRIIKLGGHLRDDLAAMPSRQMLKINFYLLGGRQNHYL